MVTTPWPALADVSHMYLLVDNWCERHYPLLQYRTLNVSEEVIDPVHDEAIAVDKRWDPVISLRAYVQPAEQGFPLTVFGIEELRDAILHVSVPSLLDAGLVTQDPVTLEITLGVAVGDRFLYTNGVVYDTLVWKIGRTFANTDVPLFYIVSCEKVHMDAAQFQGL